MIIWRQFLRPAQAGFQFSQNLFGSRAACISVRAYYFLLEVCYSNTHEALLSQQQPDSLSVRQHGCKEVCGQDGHDGTVVRELCPVISLRAIRTRGFQPTVPVRHSLNVNVGEVKHPCRYNDGSCTYSVGDVLVVALFCHLHFCVSRE